jgi:copper(I)-binding protein
MLQPDPPQIMKSARPSVRSGCGQAVRHGAFVMKEGFVLGLAVVLMAGGAWAHDYKVGSLEVDHPWSRATPKGAKVAGGYVKIRNTGSIPDRLVGGTFASSGGVEIHEMSTDRGVMKMRELQAGLEIKPGETVELKPGSFHLMFTGLTRPLAKGDRVKGTLNFEKAGSVDVEFAVEAIGATPAPHGGQAGH